ncbi:MAG TPA: HDOD domain-containing protein [Spirochaetia bacterium]|nr:HDOD domain-containing protein [Spirochaetia bacterium]
MKEAFLERMKDLPVMPEVAARVLSLKEAGVGFRELESIIKVDPALTARILKVANSALYARQKEITSLQMAISLLGFTNIRNLVLLVTASSFFPRMKRSAFHQAFWRHSILSAFLSRNFTQACAGGSAAEEAFIAGLLHDIGQAALFSHAPEQYQRALETEKLGAMSLETIEEQLFEVNHRDLGGALLRKWNFPDLYADAAEQHESLNVTSAHKTVILLVTVACLLAARIGGQVLTPARADLLAQIMPYTCFAAISPESLAQEQAWQLSQDPLYRECQELFGIR